MLFFLRSLLLIVSVLSYALVLFYTVPTPNPDTLCKSGDASIEEYINTPRQGVTTGVIRFQGKEMSRTVFLSGTDEDISQSFRVSDGRIVTQSDILKNKLTIHEDFSKALEELGIITSKPGFVSIGAPRCKK